MFPGDHHLDSHDPESTVHLDAPLPSVGKNGSDVSWDTIASKLMSQMALEFEKEGQGRVDDKTDEGTSVRSFFTI